MREFFVLSAAAVLSENAFLTYFILLYQIDARYLSR